MSRRRIASKIPALDYLVEMPPVSDFLSAHPMCPAKTSNILNSSASAHFPENMNPVTPLDQIIHTPEEPPSPCRSRFLASKPKLSILTTIRAAPIQQYDMNANTEPDSPYLPFTPLDSPTCLDSPTLEVVSHFTQLKVGDTPAPRTTSPPSIIKTTNHKTPRSLPFCLPRRLSYRAVLPSAISPLTPNMAFSLSQPTEGSDLASPLSLRRMSLSTASQPMTPLLPSSPALSSRSPGYF